MVLPETLSNASDRLSRKRTRVGRLASLTICVCSVHGAVKGGSLLETNLVGYAIAEFCHLDVFDAKAFWSMCGPFDRDLVVQV